MVFSILPVGTMYASTMVTFNRKIIRTSVAKDLISLRVLESLEFMFQ